ncbi:unnamed protein product, partial [Mesorhabditis spiculigera]
MECERTMQRNRSTSPGWKPKIFDDKADLYDVQSTASIVLWILMQLHGLYALHQNINHQLPDFRFVIESVMPGWEYDEWRWPALLRLHGFFIYYGSFLVAALASVFMLVPVSDGTSRRTTRIYTYTYTRIPSLKGLEKQRRSKSSTLNPIYRVPYVGEWLRREWDNYETYDCNEQRGHYEAFVVGRMFGGFLTAFFVPYWYWRFGPRSLDDAYNFAEEFPRRLEERRPFTVQLDWITLFVMCSFYSLMFAGFPQRRPRNEHARPGKCCPRQPTKQMVVAWRYKWLKMRTQQ